MSTTLRQASPGCTSNQTELEDHNACDDREIRHCGNLNHGHALQRLRQVDTNRTNPPLGIIPYESSSPHHHASCSHTIAIGYWHFSALRMPQKKQDDRYSACEILCKSSCNTSCSRELKSYPCARFTFGPGRQYQQPTYHEHCPSVSSVL